MRFLKCLPLLRHWVLNLLGKWMRSYFLFFVLSDVLHSCEALDGLITSPGFFIKFLINNPYKKKKNKQEVFVLKGPFGE